MKQLQKQPNFDRVARIYRWAEYLALGSLLQRTRTHFLGELQDCRSALVLGDGDGRFLAALLRGNTQLRAVAVDISAEMLRLLRRRCAFSESRAEMPAESRAESRLKTVHASALDVAVPDDLDLVVTQFFLDSLEQHDVETLVQHIATHTSTDLLWLISDFQQPPGVWRLPAKIYIRSLYFAFRVLTGLRVQQLPETRSVLANAGFHRVAYHQKLGGMIYTELWKFSGSGFKDGIPASANVLKPA